LSVPNRGIERTANHDVVALLWDERQSFAVRYTLALFDFDGTLADTFPWFLSAVNRMAETHGFKRIDAGEVETLRGYSARQIVEHLGVPAWKLPRIGIDMRRLMAEDIRQIHPFEGIGAMLRNLSDRGVALAVVTSNVCDNVRHVLGAEHAARIRYYECGASLFGKGGKLRRVLKQSSVRPGEAIFIGDEIRDIEAARAEGIPFGAVAWGYTRVEALEAYAPAEVFADVGEVVEKVAIGELPYER
jgi:phosphoglycolate phosphatase